jgi:hypothetical protein
MRVALRAAEAPFTFDASLALFAGLDVVLALAAGLAVAADDPVVARQRADVVGEGGVDAGTIATVATVERRSGGYRCIAQLTEARVALEVGERVTAIGARTITAVAQEGGIALLSATTVATSRGRELAVLTTAALVGAEAGPRCSLAAQPASIGRGAAVIRLDAT